MKNTHTLFGDSLSWFQEGRLAWFAKGGPSGTPKRKDVIPPVGEDYNDFLEKNREVTEKVWGYLDDAAKGNPDLQELLAKPEMRNVIAALVEIHGGDTIRWLNQTSVLHLQQTHEAYKEQGELLKEHKAKAAASAEGLISTLGDAMQEYEDAQKQYADFNGSKADIPTGVAEAFAVLKAKSSAANSDAIIAQRHKMLDDVLKIINDEGLTPAQRKQKLDALKQAGTKLFEKNELQLIENAIRQLKARIEELQRQQDNLITMHHPERYRFLSKLAGYDLTTTELLEATIVEEQMWDADKIYVYLMLRGYTNADLTELQNRKNDHKALGEYLRSLGVPLNVTLPGVVTLGELALSSLRPTEKTFDIDDIMAKLVRQGLTPERAKIQAITDAYDQAIATINQTDGIKNPASEPKKDAEIEKAKQKLATYFESLGLRNPSGVSIPQLYLRATLPDTLPKQLEDQGLKDMSMRVLFEMAKLENVDTDPAITAHYDKLFAMFAEKKDDGSVEIDETQFKDVIKFMLVGSTRTTPEQIAQIADAYFAQLRDNKIFVKTDNVITLTKNDVGGKKPQEALEEFLTTMQTVKIDGADTDVTLGFTPMAQTFIKEMRGAGTHELTFVDKVKRTTSETLSTIGTGAKYWFEWIKTMPSNFYNPTLDPQLKELIYQRRALQDMQDALQDSIQAGLDSSTAFGRARRDLEGNKKARDQVGDLTSIRLDPKSNINAARHLLRVVEHVQTELSKDLAFKELSAEGRHMALWIAMNTGKDGLKEARAFVKSYRKDAVGTMQRYLGTSKHAPEAAKFVRRVLHYKQIEGKDILTPLKRHDITIKPLALQILERMNRDTAQGMGIDEDKVRPSDSFYHHVPSRIEHWLTDRESAVAPLSAILESPLVYPLDAQKEAFNDTTLIDTPYGVAIEKSAMAQMSLMVLRNGTATTFNVEAVHPDSGAKTMEQITIEFDQAFATARSMGLAKHKHEIMLEAFVSGEDRTVMLPSADGKQAIPYTITAREAYDGVARIQEHLMDKAKKRNPSVDQLEEEDFYKSPLDAAMRSGMETLRELWAGDMVDKGKVAIGVIAALWLMRKSWKEDGFGKKLMIGLPLAMLANSMYKNQTGRDFLGEKLKHMNDQERGTPLELFRRRAARNEKYEILRSEAGHEALRQLTGPGTKVSVRDLMDWRLAVRRTDTGANDYEVGAPDKLSIAPIMWELGSDATRQDAYEVAFIVYEALLQDVAALHGEDSVLWGERYILDNYVVYKQYSDQPAYQRQMQNEHRTMLDVIIAEYKTPEVQDALREDRTFTEWVGDGMGAMGSGAMLKGEQATAWVQRQVQQAGHHIPDVWERGKEMAFETYDQVAQYLSVTSPKVWSEVRDSFVGVWGFISGAGKEAGITVIQTGGDVIEWTFDTSVAGAEKAKEVATNIYGMLLDNGVTGPMLTGLVGKFKEVFGVDIDAKFRTPDYIAILTQNAEIHAKMEKQLSSFVELPSNFQTLVGGWAKKIDTNVDSYDSEPEKRMLVYEQLKRDIYSFVIAERLKAIRHEAKDNKNFTRLSVPIQATWPDTSKAFHEHMVGDEFYEYIRTNYTPENIISLIGNQGTGIINLRSRASQYLKHDLENYIEDVSKKAKEDFGEDSEEYKDFKAYLDTLIMNVIVEAALSKHKQPTDLKLLVGHAQDMLRHLYLRRGITPSKVGEVHKDTLKKFRFATASKSRPADLDDMLNDPRLRDAIKGDAVEPEEDEDKDTKVGTLKKKRIPKVDRREAQQIKTLDPSSKANQDKMLGALRSTDVDAADKDTIRGKFDTRWQRIIAPKIIHVDSSGKEHTFLDDPSLDDRKVEERLSEIARFVIGVSTSSGNIKQIEDKLISAFTVQLDGDTNKRLKRVKYLRNSLGEARDTEPDPESEKRLQHALDVVILQVLKDLTTEISSLTSDQLKSHSNLDRWMTTLVELYKLTNKKTDEVTDVVSMALEWMYFHKGEDMSKYEEFLKSKGVELPTKDTYGSGNGAKKRLGLTGSWGNIPNNTYVGIIQGRIATTYTRIKTP